MIAVEPRAAATVRNLIVAAAPWVAGRVVALMAGDAVAVASGSPRPAGPVGGPIPWAQCDTPGAGLQCARIRVPLDPSTCVDQAIAAYLTELTTPPRGAVCPSNQQPFDPDFTLGGG